MSLFSKLKRWWQSPRHVVRTKPRRRTALGFDVLESRTLLSAPIVSLTALPLAAGAKPQVVVTATDTTKMTSVAIDVGLDGSQSFSGPDDMNQTVVNVNLVSGKATTITLNAFPPDELSSYYVRARVTDAAGNVGSSSIVTMKGPQPDTLKLTVPATVTGSADTASVQITAGSGNGYTGSVSLYTSLSGGPFQLYPAAVPGKTGAASFTLANLAAGSYQVRAQITDSTGNIDDSPVQNVVVSPPQVSITALPLMAGARPQVIVTASDASKMNKVAIDVSFDGSLTFGGAGDVNQTVQSIALANNQPVIVTLNAFPPPGLWSYLVRARVMDNAGNQGTSSTVLMEGVTPDTLKLTAPATVSATNNAATVQVTLGQDNKYPSSVTIAVDATGDGIFQTFSTVSLNSTGAATIPLSSLPAGATYRFKATATDPAGNALVSAIDTVTVAAAPAPAGTSGGAAAPTGPISLPANSNPPPLTIIPNVGQVNTSAAGAPNVQFEVPFDQSNILLSANELDLVPPSTSITGQQQVPSQRMVLVGANGNALGVGTDPLASYSNFDIGSLNQTNVPNFGQAIFVNVYPGINLTYQGQSGTLEYSFTVSPKANPAGIVLNFPGDVPSLNGAGDLILTLPNGSTVSESQPVAYQVTASGAQQAVTAHFALNGGQVTFALGTYNSALPLLIDPYIYTNFLTSNTTVNSTGGMAEDAFGNIYVLANTNGNNFAGQGGASTGVLDVVVTKLNSAGVPQWTTYLGGTAASIGNAIAVDNAGNVYITGMTQAGIGFPQTANTFTNADFGLVAGDQTAFVSILASTGGIVQSTIFGGTNGVNQTAGEAIGIDGLGNIWVAGVESNPGSFNGAGTFNNPNFASSPYDVGTSGPPPALGTRFLAKFAPLNIMVPGYQYTDFFAGDLAGEAIFSMAIDSLNRIYLVGSTLFPHVMPWTSNPAQFTDTLGVAESNAYISTLAGAGGAGFLPNLAGVVLQFQEDAATFNAAFGQYAAGQVVPFAVITYGSFIGGTQTGAANTTTNTTGVVVKDLNAPNSSIANIYLTGTTNVNNFFQTGTPNRNPAQADSDAYLLELQVGPATVLPNTGQLAGVYIGTAGNNEIGESIAVDSQGNIYVDGQIPPEAASAQFDTNPVQPFQGIATNVFLTVFNPTATSILLGTPLGGNNVGEVESPAGSGNSLIVDPNGAIYIAGLTTNVAAFQGTVTGVGGSSVIYSSVTNPGTFVTKLDAVAAQSLGQDQFEPDDTSDLAANLDAFASTNLFGQTVFGPFPNLNTGKHVGGPVGDGLNYNGLFDYDWYQVLPPSAGPLTVTISNITIFASGPNSTPDTGGDLDLYVYQVINGYLYLLGSSTLINSVVQSTTVNVTPGADILIDVNPYNYTQASYTLGVTLA